MSEVTYVGGALRDDPNNGCEGDYQHKVRRIVLHEGDIV